MPSAKLSTLSLEVKMELHHRRSPPVYRSEDDTGIHAVIRPTHRALTGLACQKPRIVSQSLGREQFAHAKELELDRVTPNPGRGSNEFQASLQVAMMITRNLSHKTWAFAARIRLTGFRSITWHRTRSLCSPPEPHPPHPHRD